VLLQHGADVNEVDANGLTPLIQCVKLRAGCRIASALLEAGADVNAAQTGGGDIHAHMTAVHFAAYIDSPDALDMLKLLLAAGACANTQCGSSGALILHLSLERCTSEVRPIPRVFMCAILVRSLIAPAIALT
jgi:ankyrin repeat protein